MDDSLAAKIDPNSPFPITPIDNALIEDDLLELRARGVIDDMIEHGYAEVVLRQGDIVEHLREQVTQPPLNPLGLRLLLDWAADEITRLRAVSS